MLLQFADALLHASTLRMRLVTYNMELNAAILMQGMGRCKLYHAQVTLERAVRTRGLDLMDPTVYAWLSDRLPTFPTLRDIAAVMPPGQRGYPLFRTGAAEVTLYLQLTAGMQELGMTVCQVAGHLPVRVSRGCCLRDNGIHSHDCARCGRFLD